MKSGRRAFLSMCMAACLAAGSANHSASAQVAQAVNPACVCPPNDWPLIGRYRDQNKKVLQEGSTGERVVFLGDSITEHWIAYHPPYFTSHNYLGRGIYGQTTPQILLRFRPDVVALKPQVVVILAGINDLAGNTGPESLEDIEGNLMSMIDLGNANHIRVILSSLLPVTDVYKPMTQKHRPADIQALNQWMQRYCGTGTCTYLNYYDSLLDGRGSLRSNLTEDGLHPNVAGYAVMEPLAESAIRRALAPRGSPGAK